MNDIELKNVLKAQVAVLSGIYHEIGATNVLLRSIVSGQPNADHAKLRKMEEDSEKTDKHINRALEHLVPDPQA